LPYLFAPQCLFSPSKDPELKGHIKAREAITGIEGDTGEVVNAVAAFSDDRVKLVESDSTSVVALQGTARQEPAVTHREDQGVEQLLVVTVERDVDENPVVVAGHDSKARGRPRLSYSRHSFVPVFLAAVFLPADAVSFTRAGMDAEEDRVILRLPVSPNCPRKRSQTADDVCRRRQDRAPARGSMA